MRKACLKELKWLELAKKVDPRSIPYALRRRWNDCGRR